MKYLSTVILMLLAAIPTLEAKSTDSLTQALTSGKAYADFRLRYESVQQDNNLQDADGLTLRTKLGYKTGDFAGFSAVIEMEDNRVVLGVDDFSVPPTGFKPGEFSVIADPESTELNQGYLQFKSDELKVKLGRQVIALDNHRFVGHVGWRQDWQTFDGVTFVYQPTKSINLQGSKLTKRNRIFAEERDLQSDDTLIHLSYDTAVGKLTGYAYLLEVEDAAGSANDTYGLRFNGSAKLDTTKLLYALELATQEQGNDIDSNYVLLEAGALLSGITFKAGFESLGSDSGQGSFSTPLATLHKFNGWTDQFLITPAQGLQDTYATVSGNAFGGKWSATYHSFSSDVRSNDSDDLGDEINLIYSKKISEHYYAGAKFGDYSAGANTFGKVDTQKLWLWAGAKF